jgi:hypothetical protein
MSSSSSSTLEPDLVKMSRAEERAAQAQMTMGKRFKVLWRYGQGVEVEATPPMTFVGTVISVEADEDGTPVTLVDYEAHEALPRGGILTFPPPPLADRQVEIFSVTFLRAPSAIPDLSALVRPREPVSEARAVSQAGAAEAQKHTAVAEVQKLPAVEDRKRPREEESLDAIARIADKLEGGGEKQAVVDGLKIPRAIRDFMVPFYPNFWFGKAAEWSNALNDSMLQMGVRFSSVALRENFFATKGSLAALLGGSRKPMTKPEWLPYFSLAASLFGFCVAGAGGTQFKADQAVSQLRNQFELGFVNAGALWVSVQDLITRRSAQTRGGRGGARGRGRGS